MERITDSMMQSGLGGVRCRSLIGIIEMNKQRAAFEAWCQERFGQVPLWDDENNQYLLSSARLRFEAYQAALESPEIQALRDALEKCRFALEPYDDIKPRDWVTDRQKLRSAHQASRTVLAAMEKQK